MVEDIYRKTGETVNANTLRRFFMLTFTYSLSKTGLMKADGVGGPRMIMRGG